MYWNSRVLPLWPAKSMLYANLASCAGHAMTFNQHWPEPVFSDQPVDLPDGKYPNLTWPMVSLEGGAQVQEHKVQSIPACFQIRHDGCAHATGEHFRHILFSLNEDVYAAGSEILPKCCPSPALCCLKASQMLPNSCLNTDQCYLNPAQMLFHFVCFHVFCPI